MRVVVAPDSFKGSASAAEAAEAIARGWNSRRPSDEIVCLPMADGGEGTMAACAAASVGAVRHVVSVRGPDDRPVDGEWLEIVREDAPSTAVVEFASGSGITLLDELRPLTAHSRGFGELIRSALDWGCDRLLLGLGGSASTDGGLGMLSALGAVSSMKPAREIDPSGGNAVLGLVRSADLSGVRDLPLGGALILSDVDSPLLGPRGAVAVFGRQKGIRAADASDAEARLAGFAAVLSRATAADARAAGAGAAGGTGFALAAWGAVSGVGSREVAGLLGLAEAVEGADVVITGEGRYDEQSHLAPSARVAFTDPFPWLERAGRLMAGRRHGAPVGGLQSAAGMRRVAGR